MESLELIEQQHLEMQELISRNQEQTEILLKGIIDALSKEKSNDDIVKAINDNINTFVKGIKLQPPEVTVESPNVNVSLNLDQDRFILSLDSATDKIVEKLEEIKPLPIEKLPEKKPENWKFNFVRNEEGIIISATANQIK